MEPGAEKISMKFVNTEWKSKINKFLVHSVICSSLEQNYRKKSKSREFFIHQCSYTEHKQDITNLSALRK